MEKKFVIFALCFDQSFNQDMLCSMTVVESDLIMICMKNASET